MEYLEQIALDLKNALNGDTGDGARDVDIVENKMKCVKPHDCPESITPVFVTGRVVPGPTRAGSGAIVSPLQGLPSTHYHIICEEEVKDGASGNVSWVPQWEETQSREFMLTDETGQSVYVLPTYAQECMRVHGKSEVISTHYTFWPSKIPQDIADLNDRYGYKVRAVSTRPTLPLVACVGPCISSHTARTPSLPPLYDTRGLLRVRCGRTVGRGGPRSPCPWASKWPSSASPWTWTPSARRISCVGRSRCCCRCGRWKTS